MCDLPGNTILPSEEYHVTTLPSFPSNKPIVIFATNDVNHHTLFQNGLTQNIVILYDLFECLGFTSYLLQASSEKDDFIHQYRTISLQDMIKQAIPISLFIEIGMSLDTITRHYLRSVGAKIVKLYLGNILNIDIETIQNFKGAVFFHHHVVGETDEIWTSPHYLQHLQYAAILNRTPIEKSRVVPYVWDSCFLTQYGTKDTMNWIPSSWIYQDIVITDPSISFQKCSFYSLLLAEAFSKKFPEWKGKVHVINGDRLTMSSHASQNILPALSLYQNKRIILHPRKKIHDILTEHRSACFITHQWNNAYNYMTLELMYCNYPILHNSDGWEPYGYHYSLQKWEEAIQTLHMALTCHKDNMNAYRTHAAQLIWKHSIHHPDIQRRWRELLS